MAAIETLMERRGAFDYILLETTGLADPGNLAPLFWVDEGLGSTIYLDGIVTLVDAKNILLSLDSPDPAQPSSPSGDLPSSDQAHPAGPHLSTANMQISHADVIVINKSDLVSPSQLTEVQNRIRAINALAKIHITAHSRVPSLEGLVLDLHAYDAVDADSLDFASKGHSHLDPVNIPPPTPLSSFYPIQQTNAERTQAIATITLILPALTAAQLDPLDAWLRTLLWSRLFLDHPDKANASSTPYSFAPTSSSSSSPCSTSTPARRPEIHRVKGRLVMRDGSVKLLQGVREVFEVLDSSDRSSPSESGKEAVGKIVLIGRDIDREALQRSLNEEVVGEGA